MRGLAFQIWDLTQIPFQSAPQLGDTFLSYITKIPMSTTKSRKYDVYLSKLHLIIGFSRFVRVKDMVSGKYLCYRNQFLIFPILHLVELHRPAI